MGGKPGGERPKTFDKEEDAGVQARRKRNRHVHRTKVHWKPVVEPDNIAELIHRLGDIPQASAFIPFPEPRGRRMSSLRLKRRESAFANSSMASWWRNPWEPKKPSLLHSFSNVS